MQISGSFAAGRTLALLTFLLLLAHPGVRADFSFVHLTDTHVTARQTADSPAAKDRALLLEIAQRTPRPRFAVLTGDVCEAGTPEEFAAFRALRDRFPVRLYVAPGNHDVRWNPQGKTGFEKGTGQPLYQSWDHENVHFVLLDSTVLLQHWGHFGRKQLDWLANDLKKVGRRKPVIIGFHHFLYRPGDAQIDNADALRKVIEPYNVRLFLIGHGHSDIEWSIDGIPAIMARGLYQGSYHLIRVTGDRLTVYRRTEKTPEPTVPILTVPLEPVKQPRREASVSVRDNIGTVRLKRGELPSDAVSAFRVNSGEEIAMEPTADGFEGRFRLVSATPGHHTVTITTTLPDQRAYQTVLPLRLESGETARRTGAREVIRPRWTFDVGGEVQGKIALSDNTLYVPTMSGDLVALRTDTGRERWRFRTGGPIFSTPLVTGNTVIFGSVDGSVYALDTATGKLRWRARTGGPVFAGAAVAGQVVCIASSDAKIYGLDLRDGRILRTVPVGGLYQSQAATDGTRFFLGGWDNAFRCLDAATGQEIWQQKFGRNARGDLLFYYAPAIGSPAVGDGRVYVTSNDGWLHAMDAASGNVLWEVRGPSLGYGSPLLHQGRIYGPSLTPQGRVFCFDAGDGKKIWEQPTGSVIYDSSCAFGGGNIYVGGVDGTFSALRADDGSVLWQYRLSPGHLLSSPVTDDHSVYIGSLSGEVSAFPLTLPPGKI
ncbi:MAG: PQQ-binding-like beta-propeller repeat protein [Capsulimonadales bacterium]|nr:PQQ-binding-like beta-propeller repeat protein [Capsulimonadales bacterium]